MRTKGSIYRVIARSFMLGLLAVTAMAQNPPATGDPYAREGIRKARAENIVGRSNNQSAAV